jgi:hypothetical protein
MGYSGHVESAESLGKRSNEDAWEISCSILNKSKSTYCSICNIRMRRRKMISPEHRQNSESQQNESTF